MTTELIPVTSQKEIEKIFLSDDLQAAVDAIEKDGLNYVANISTAAGRKDCISKAASISKQKVVIDNARKALKESYMKKCNDIDSVGKKVRERLEALRDTVRKPVTDWEKAEEERIEAERKQAEWELDEAEAYKEDDIFNREKAIAEKEAEMKRQEEERIAKEKAEREEKERLEREARIAEEARKKAEKEAQEKIEAEKRAKIEAELKAKQEAEKAEREKKEAAERAEREKLEAIEKAKREEKERQERIQREKAEADRIEREKAEKKAANIRHQKKINREALKDLVSTLNYTEENAKDLITAIAHKKIRHISVNY